MLHKYDQSNKTEKVKDTLLSQNNKVYKVKI